MAWKKPCCGAEAMHYGRGYVEKVNVWKKCGGYGEIGGETLKEVRPTFKRELLASRRRNSM